MLSPKANFLETVKKDGHPDRLPSCYTAFRPIGGDPCFQLIRGNRIRGTESIDAWGTHISFPQDAPLPSPSSRRRTRSFRTSRNGRNM